MRFYLTSISLFFAFLTSNFAQNTATLVGSVIDKNTQESLIGATVLIENTNLGATTDADGRFRITNIPPKSYTVSVKYLGFTNFTKFNVVILTGNDTQLNFELVPNAQKLGEVVIAVNKSTRVASIETPLSIQNLSVEEIRSNPGGNFDISKVVQVLPGVGAGAGGGGERNDLLIRGGGPSENVYFLDAMEIPVINHFATQGAAGGPAGILNVSFIEDATISTSAFNAKYGNALSGVLQFKQRDGNPDHFQGNFRLSGTETALTVEGPLAKNGRTTFIASARRSYLQFLFAAIGLPIRPDYWDFQYKITHKFNSKTTFTSLGVGAIDQFYFGKPKNATPELLYILGAVPSNNQWNYTQGFALKRLMNDGFFNLVFSRNMLDTRFDRFEDNFNGNQKDENKRVLKTESQEIENKLRFDINKYVGNWKYSLGADAQFVKYNNTTFNKIRSEIRDSSGQIVQPALTINFASDIKFAKYGLFAQANRTFLGERLAISLGLRTDGNTFTKEGTNILKQFSPRGSISFAVADGLKINASAGRYLKIAPYTMLGYKDEQGVFVNKNVPYLQSNHLVAGLEFVPNPSLRMTVEGFLKKYTNYPVSVRNGVSLANFGSDYGIFGNEPVLGTGDGKAVGLEFFIQQKLRKKLFFTASYTLFRSKFSGNDRRLIASAWDNRHLFSGILGYKLPKNWEIGAKYRFQGGVPYTPFDLAASQINYPIAGQGVLNYAKLNTKRLRPFSALDVRIDKKWNFRRTSLDLFLDVTNVLSQKSAGYPNYTFLRNTDNSTWDTTNGLPLAQDGSNAKPIVLDNLSGLALPSLGIIFAF
jgi:hypothetical protein